MAVAGQRGWSDHLAMQQVFDRDQSRPGINQIAWDRLGNGGVHQY
jgi:hypothetical protein